MLYMNSAVPKPAMRRAADAMVQEFLAKGGKVRHVPCTGKTPTLPNHYCDPRNRQLFFSTAPAARGGQRHIVAGTARLIKG